MSGKLESMETKTYGIFFLKAAEQFSYPQIPMVCQNSNWAWKTVATLPALAAETIMGLHMHTNTSTHVLGAASGLKKENQGEMEMMKYLKQKTGMFEPRALKVYFQVHCTPL